MKVAIITPFYRPSIGGVEYIVYHTAMELVKRGYAVHVITLCYDNRWKVISNPGTVTEQGIVVHRLNPSFIRLGYATIMRGLKEILQKIDPDIVHCHNLHPHLFQAIKWKESMKYRLVAQLHYPVATGLDHFSARLLYRFAIKILVAKQGIVDFFVAHTNLERNWLIEEGISNKRVKVIRYPCIPDSLFNYAPTDDIHNRLSADIVITYISRIHPRKGQHLLIQASKYLQKELKDFKIYMAGPISDKGYLKSLRNMIEKLNLKKHLMLDPRALSNKEKLDAIASADICAFTSTNDYTPVVVLEALALNTPVVATTVGAIPELLATDSYDRDLAELVCIVPPVPREIANAIQLLISRLNGASLNKLQRIAFSHKISTLVDSLEKEVYLSPDR